MSAPLVGRHREEIERFTLRPADFTLTDEQSDLRELVRGFLAKQCAAERVRAAEPTGWDPQLWQELAALNLVAIGLPEDRGGDGAGMVELALVAEEFGRAAAPVPIIDVIVAARLLERLNGPAEDLYRRCLDGEVIAPAVGHHIDGRYLVPAGAAATTVLACHDGAVFAAQRPAPPPPVANLANAPLAWWDLAEAEVLDHGAGAVSAFEQAQREWQLLTAAALIGLGDSAKNVAADYARERTAFGVAIGTFQAVAHPLTEVQILIDSGRRLVHKAAWFVDHEPESLGPLVTMAFLHAAEAAEQAGMTAIRTQGGFGFMLESDAQLFYRRSKGWAQLGGDRATLLQRIADEMLGGDR